MLVEDDHGCRLMYAEWLAQAGFRVIQAHNGLQALERLVEEDVPDVVVIDLNIPGIDGFELTRRLRQHPTTAHVPVLAVTGYAPFAATPERALRAGCDAMLLKPYSPENFEVAIRSLIDHRQPTRA